jgi:hypothetical protein
MSFLFSSISNHFITQIYLPSNNIVSLGQSILRSTSFSLSFHVHYSNSHSHVFVLFKFPCIHKSILNSAVDVGTKSFVSFVFYRIIPRQRLKVDLCLLLLTTLTLAEVARITRKCVFSVMRICPRTRDWPACVKFYATDDTQFQTSVLNGLRDSIDNR